jgi:hypothetical protein
VVEGKPPDVPASKNPVQRAVSVDRSERRAVDQRCHEVAVPQRQSGTTLIDDERDLAELVVGPAAQPAQRMVMTLACTRPLLSASTNCWPSSPGAAPTASICMAGKPFARCSTSRALSASLARGTARYGHRQFGEGKPRSGGPCASRRVAM